MNNEINITIEIPLGSIEKIEWKPDLNRFDIDRNEPSAFPEPVNYGFISNTIGGDGDYLDAFIVTDKVFKTGDIIKAKIVGLMKFIDDGDVDDKVVAVMSDSDVKGLDDLDQGIITKIEDYYNHYKDYIKPSITKVLGWGNTTDAVGCIEQASKAWSQKQ